MVIIEGPDHAGKSTLIRHIQETLGDAVELSPHSRMSKDARNDPAFRDPENVKTRVYESISAPGALRSQGPVILHDRLFFSALVYDNVFGREPTFNWKEEVHICRLLTAISPPIVFCLPPLEDITSKIYGATEMEGVTDNIARIYRAYDVLSALSHPGIVRYDYTRGPAAKSRICRLIQAYATRRNARRYK